MIALDPHVDGFIREAEAVFGCTPAAATLEDRRWVQKLAPLTDKSGAGSWTPQLITDDDAIDPSDWKGVMSLWPNTPDHVLIRRIPFLGAYSDQSSVTILAARTPQCLERAIRHCRALYREWRRTRARVRDARGADMDVFSVDWNQVYLPQPLIDEIRSNVLHFAAARDLYQQLGLPYRRGLLFYGGPGNGKTMICRAIVTALGWPVVYVSPNSRSEAPYELRTAFKDAIDLAPSVLWFDDVDSLFETDATMSSFLNRLDGASSAEGILVLATTNRPERLDPAMVARPSRFDRIFEIGPPAATERGRFFTHRFGSQLDAAARADLVERTSGMSMAFIQEVFVGAALKALERGGRPTESDAVEVLEALLRHSRAADRGFQSDAPTGFALLR